MGILIYSATLEDSFVSLGGEKVLVLWKFYNDLVAQILCLEAVGIKGDQ